jgi:hypothetical protein
MTIEFIIPENAVHHLGCRLHLELFRDMSRAPEDLGRKDEERRRGALEQRLSLFKASRPIPCYRSRQGGALELRELSFPLDEVASRCIRRRQLQILF